MRLEQKGRTMLDGVDLVNELSFYLKSRRNIKHVRGMITLFFYFKKLRLPDREVGKKFM
jgi:hypothetical protein